jgi:hypothetical protein
MSRSSSRVLGCPRDFGIRTFPHLRLLLLFQLAVPTTTRVAAEAKTLIVAGRDSAAIQDAIGQAEAGDTVSLPEGLYAIREPLRPKSGIRLEGAGSEKTILKFAGIRPSVLVDLAERDEVELSAFTLDGAEDPRATQGIAASHARRLRLHRLRIRNLAKTPSFGPHGILFSGTNPTREGGVTESEISDCEIENIGVGTEFGCGIRLSWGSSKNRVLRCRVKRTGRGGIFADNGSTDLVIRENEVEGSGGEGLGIEVWGGCDRAVIEDNRIDHWLSFGGCDWGAARRNVVGRGTEEYKFCGIEAIGSRLVITRNEVEGSQKIGLSVSGGGKKEYVFWGWNTVRGSNQWGAQFQGEASGAACHYLYRNRFLDMPVGQGPVWYPGDEGHGFRVNGNVRHLTFEECEFRKNGRFGLQLIGGGVDHLDFVRCSIRDNGGPAVVGPEGYEALEWRECEVTGNAVDALPVAKRFARAAPTLAISAPVRARRGEPVRFASEAQAAPGGKIAAVLWDLDDGPPLGDARVEHAYERAGNYLVTLIAWDDGGRAARAEHRLEVEP